MDTANSGEPLTVLVVDDEEPLRSVICGLLETEGYRLLDAEGGNDALEIVKNQKIDVVLTDINMPKGSGLELLRQVKSLNPYHPSVLLITGVDSVSTPLALDSGAEDLLVKPFEPEVLFAAIKKASISPKQRWESAGPSDEIFSFNLELQFKSFEEALSSGAIEIGQAGMFLQMRSGNPLSFQRIRFSLNFLEGAVKRLAGDGLVRWSRPHSVRGLKSGIGIEFRYVDSESSAVLSKLISERRITSFIPKGWVKKLV